MWKKISKKKFAQTSNQPVYSFNTKFIYKQDPNLKLLFIVIICVAYKKKRGEFKKKIVYSNCCVAHRVMGGCKSPLLPSCSIVWGVPVNTPGLRMHHSSGFRAVPFSALTKRLSEGGKKSFASPLSPTLHGNRGSGAEAGSSYPSGGKRESSL